MKCGSCGFANSEDRSACERCGAPLHVGCARCGFGNSREAAYCGGCGTPLGKESAAPGLPRRERDGKSIRDALVSERKLLTVMFADTKGSLELMEGRDAEQSQALLDSVIKAMIDAVHRYGGTVNRVAGDGIMALFGAPIAQEDHAIRACYAALAMQDLMADGNSERARQFGVEPQIRVGLHSGEVVVQPIDNDVALEYRVVGTTAHVASRMEQMARPGSVLLSETTARLAKGFVQVEPLEITPVKGLREPISIFELKAAVPGQSRFQVAVARGLARLTGRGAELSAMSEALACAAAGAGQVVALSGDPGIGKSRLCHELAASASSEIWLKLHAGGVSHGQTTPYLPWTGLLKSYFGIDDTDATGTVQAKIVSALTRLDPALEGHCATLIPFLDTRQETPEWRALDPPQRRNRIFDALAVLLLALARARPLLLVLEDLHWFDSASRAFLDDLVDRLPDACIAIYLTFRPEFQHPWSGRTRLTEIRLQPLATAEAGELLRHLVGEDESVRPLERLLVERAEGNPFFIEEIVRSLAETGGLEGRGGRYRLKQGASIDELPATLEAVIASRVDRLPRSSKELLQAVAAIGRTARIDLLHSVAGGDHERMQGDLQTLREAGMLHDIRLFPAPEMAFGHALTQEVVYRTLLRSRRTELHRRVVQALEELFAGRLVDHVDTLADHAFRGELWNRAVQYHLQAAARALARSAHRDAVAIADRGLIAATHQDDHALRTAAEIDLRLTLCVPLHAVGDLPRLLKTIGEAETLAETLGDPKRRSVVANLLTVSLFLSGNHRRALSVARRAVALAKAPAELSQQVNAGYRLGVVFHALGEFHRAVATLQALLPLVVAENERERFGSVYYPSVGIRAFLAESLIELGDFAAAAQQIATAQRIANALRHPLSQAIIAFSEGTLLLVRGETKTAFHVFDDALRLCRENELLTLYPAVVAYFGLSCAANGDIPGGIAVLEKALREEVYRYGGSYTKFYLLHNLGRVYLASDRFEDAVRLATQAEAFTRETGERAHQAYALKLLGEIAVRSRTVSAAGMEHCRAAIAIAERCDMKPLLADCHVLLSTLYAAEGDQRAADERRIAGALYRSIGLVLPDSSNIGPPRQAIGEEWRQNDD
jgi:predicted ATPase/class 3 adenylate cyclase